MSAVIYHITQKRVRTSIIRVSQDGKGPTALAIAPGIVVNGTKIEKKKPQPQKLLKKGLGSKRGWKDLFVCVCGGGVGVCVHECLKYWWIFDLGSWSKRKENFLNLQGCFYKTLFR